MARSFFILLLLCRVRPGDHRPRLPHPEAHLAKEALALPRSQRDPILRLDELGKGLAIPEVGSHPNIQRRPPKDVPDLAKLFVPESGWPPWPLQIDKSGKTLCLETVDPVFHGPRGIPKQPPDFRTTHPLCDKQHRMEAMVVSRIPRPANLILEAKYHQIGVWYREFFHASTIPHSELIRKYL